MGNRLKFYGWGFENTGLTEGEREHLFHFVAACLGVEPRIAPPPRAADIALSAPRVAPSATLASVLTQEPYERLLHTYGKSYPETVRAFARDFASAPDLVALPQSEADVAAVLDWASQAKVAVIPFGGGSSVVGGVEPAVGDGYAGAVSLDLRHLDRVLEVDATSRAARIESGIRGPAIEAALKPQGLAIRHYPQSFEFSTLGGWIATRSGGHFATLYTHIDDFVESLRTMAQAGLYPSNLRVIDNDEAGTTGVNAYEESLLVLAFESADHPVDAWMARAIELLKDHGGRRHTDEGAGQRWRTAFIRMPYARELTVPMDVINDTFESAITWDKFEAFHEGVRKATEDALKEATGHVGTVSTRFTHVYPDGPALYYTFSVKGAPGRLIEQWRHIKARASDALIAAGGTITHHHAVGRDHMAWYRAQRPTLFGSAFAAAKTALDPAGIMNPGVLAP